MYEASFEDKVELIRAKDARYQREAYLFVREALDHTQKGISKDSRGRIRHVTGQELLAGIRDFALHEFGPMALMLLNEWGIHTCQDFGEIVFNMVETGGAPGFSAGDIRDMRSFAAKLKRRSEPVSEFLWDRLSDAARKDLAAKSAADALKTVLAKELSEIIRNSVIYDEKRFAGVTLSEQARALLGHNLRGTQLALFNRILLEDAYPEEIAKSDGLLAKTEKDSRADFENGYDFYEAFRKPFLPPSKLAKTELAPAPSTAN